MNIYFISKSMAGKQLTYNNNYLKKLFIMQVESIKMHTTAAATDPKSAQLN